MRLVLLSFLSLCFCLLGNYSFAEEAYVYVEEDVSTYSFITGKLHIPTLEVGKEYYDVTMLQKSGLNFEVTEAKVTTAPSTGTGSSVWSTSGSDAYYSSGKVGIGTSSPSYNLDVTGNINFTGNLYKNGSAFSSGGTTGGGSISSAWTTSGSDIYYSSGNVGIGTLPKGGLKLDIKSASAGYTGMRLTNTDSSTMEWILLANSNGTNYAPSKGFGIRQSIGGGQHATRFVIDTSGNVGINTSSPSYKLHVNGTAAGTSWTNLSSREYKDNIKKVGSSRHDEMLSKLMKVDLNTYNYKEEYGDDHSTKLGFIAEELPEEVLSTDGKGVDVYELLRIPLVL